MRCVPTIGCFERFASLPLEQLKPGRSMRTMHTAGNIVRQTTIAHDAPLQWEYDMQALAADIQLKSAPCLPFNSAMIELYTDAARTMRYHSDMALDLDPGTKIAIVSFYPTDNKAPDNKASDNKAPDAKSMHRTLVIRDKVTRKVRRVPLADRTAIVFDLVTNARFTHRIVGRGTYLCVTLRTAIPRVEPLRLATEEERIALLHAKHEENTRTDFKWPQTPPYTISPADLLEPIRASVVLMMRVLDLAEQRAKRLEELQSWSKSDA